MESFGRRGSEGGNESQGRNSSNVKAILRLQEPSLFYNNGYYGQN